MAKKKKKVCDLLPGFACFCYLSLDCLSCRFISRDVWESYCKEGERVSSSSHDIILKWSKNSLFPNDSTRNNFQEDMHSWMRDETREPYSWILIASHERSSQRKTHTLFTSQVRVHVQRRRCSRKSGDPWSTSRRPSHIMQNLKAVSQEEEEEWSIMQKQRWDVRNASSSTKFETIEFSRLAWLGLWVSCLFFLCKEKCWNILCLSSWSCLSVYPSSLESEVLRTSNFTADGES